MFRKPRIESRQLDLEEHGGEGAAQAVSWAMNTISLPDGGLRTCLLQASSMVACVVVCLVLHAGLVAGADDSDPRHMVAHSEKPKAWPDGIVPYDVSKLAPEQ